MFMIDGSKGFRKDGAKNRLRERDIHRIVDVFNAERETPGYARRVPLTEIASAANGYNLNIPRYIDSSEPEDLHDLGAHLHGGIPNRDIDALGPFWAVFPGLRQRLFAPGNREGCSNMRVGADDVRAVVLGREEFGAYRERVHGVFTSWWKEHSSRLHGLGVEGSAKALVRELSDDLLGRFAGLPLLDCYDIYQCLMDYWDEVMQDDVSLVVTEGWVEAARPRVLAGGGGKGVAESPDLTVKRTKYKMDLLPPELVAARYFAGEQGEVERLRADEEKIGRGAEAFVEENTGEDGLLDGATTDAGKVTRAAVSARRTEIGDHPEDPGERDAVDFCLFLMKAHARAKKAVKDAQARLDAKVLAQYAMLGAAEIADMVVDAKWTASIEDAIGQQVERLTDGLVGRVRVLEARYAAALLELVGRVAGFEARVKSHLRDMGLGG